MGSGEVADFELLDCRPTPQVLKPLQSDLGKTDRKVTLLPNYNDMSLTSKEHVESEKRRREYANARMREKVAAARRRGICRCGGKLDKKPGTRRN